MAKWSEEAKERVRAARAAKRAELAAAKQDGGGEIPLDAIPDKPTVRVRRHRKVVTRGRKSFEPRRLNGQILTRLHFEINGKAYLLPASVARELYYALREVYGQNNEDKNPRR